MYIFPNRKAKALYRKYVSLPVINFLLKMTKIHCILKLCPNEYGVLSLYLKR